MPEQSPRIAVAIPCFNEAAAIAGVVLGFRAALPEAEIVVFDNNSTDRTGEIAQENGAGVELVRDQGKGYAVQAIFARFADYDAVLIADGDGTYPPESARELLAPVLDGVAEMTVGARKPIAEEGAMSPVRGLGNVLIRSAFRVLIGKGPGDMLSGYRAFSRKFLHEFRPRSGGFEIETELTGAAVAGGFRVVEIATPYHPRVAGTESKLRAFRDGTRILRMILGLAISLRPARLMGLGFAAGIAVAATAWTIIHFR